MLLCRKKKNVEVVAEARLNIKEPSLMKDKYVLFHEVNTSSRFYRIGMPLENDIKSRLYL